MAGVSLRFRNDAAVV